MDGTSLNGMDAESTVVDAAAEVLRARSRLLADNVRSSILPTLLGGALFAGFFTWHADAIHTWIWWGVLLVVVGSRWWLAPRVGATETLPAPLLVGLVGTGILWGAAPFLVDATSDDLRMVMALLLPSGIALAALGTFGVEPLAAAAVALPIALCNVALTASTRSPAWMAIGAALVLMYAHQALVMRKARNVLVTQIRLRVDNERMNAELSAQAERTSTELDRRLELERVLRASRDRAERQSATDALTDIANRRYFDKRLKSEVSRAFRERTTLSLVICDIDYFKQFNDTYGHQKGDECLKAFARTLDHFCRRGGDLPARIGGEEFALLLPNTEHVNALKLADNARAAFDALAIEHRGSKLKPNVTASFGVATVIPDNLGAGEILMRNADRALYAAKEGGRNLVVSERAADSATVEARTAG